MTGIRPFLIRRRCRAAIPNDLESPISLNIPKPCPGFGVLRNPFEINEGFLIH